MGIEVPLLVRIGQSTIPSNNNNNSGIGSTPRSADSAPNIGYTNKLAISRFLIDAHRSKTDLILGRTKSRTGTTTNHDTDKYELVT